MNTETPETPETLEPTSEVLTDDGVITPTPSRTKAGWFEHSASWAVVAVTLIVMFVGGITWAFHMGMGVQKNEITSTKYNQAGQCLYVQSFRIPGMESGENPVLFAKYQEAHPKETPQESKINRGCPIVFENNSKH